ncbi:hypothetical protein O181_112935 [Austropuccinia psidii MF-1]|uniref:GAG-pre-integrase domain-containing protein n=1 Tax=Austropuccinia psidii MF-1 TaxID=1389203 RepID=A0A9Q3K5E7_9BASI|nr:hypothetical protein [Austropuccinia psidii MF-1]
MDHGLKPVVKGGSFLIMKDKRIIATFARMGNLFATKIHSQSIFAVSPSELKKDWHTILGHPSDLYIKKLISDQRLTGAFTPSSECQVCLHAKLKRLPHLRRLPVTHSPFIKLHMDTLEVSPPSRQGILYVLVIIDDFSRFNPTHASLLLNLLPNQYLQMKSPNDVLFKHSAIIQPTFKPSQIIPFGIKVAVRNENSGSKVNVTASSMKALTFEPYSDALRVLDSSTGKIRVTRDYAQLKFETLVILWKDPSSLPCMASLAQPRVASLPVLKSQCSNASDSGPSQPNEELTPTDNPDHGTSNRSVKPKPRYDYVPYYDIAPQEVSSEVSQQNILRGEKRNRHPPD